MTKIMGQPMYSIFLFCVSTCHIKIFFLQKSLQLHDNELYKIIPENFFDIFYMFLF